MFFAKITLKLHLTWLLMIKSTQTTFPVRGTTDISISKSRISWIVKFTPINYNLYPSYSLDVDLCIFFPRIITAELPNSRPTMHFSKIPKKKLKNKKNERNRKLLNHNGTGANFTSLVPVQFRTNLGPDFLLRKHSGSRIS